MGLFERFVLWLTGDESTARAAAETHHARSSVGLPVTYEGEEKAFVDGAELGGVVWPVEQHGALAFVTRAVFLAYYDHDLKQCFMLDDFDGARHPGAKPLVLDDDFKTEAGRSGKGYVVRTAEYGTEGIYKNVFVPADGVIISDHLGNPPGANSTPVYDPSTDPDDDPRSGPIHYTIRVRRWLSRKWAAARYKGKEVFATLLNFGANGDGTPAYGATHWDRGDGMLSDEAKGPLALADDGNHLVDTTDDGRIHQGGINVREALFGGGNAIYSPADFNPDQLPPRRRGPITSFVEWREDYRAQHVNLKGKRVPGTKFWYAEDVIGEKSPGVPTEGPPWEGPPEGPPEDNPPPVYPAMSVPPEQEFFDNEDLPPTAATPYETEAPSHYGHPMPRATDGPSAKQGRPITGADADDTAHNEAEVSELQHVKALREKLRQAVENMRAKDAAVNDAAADVREAKTTLERLRAKARLRAAKRAAVSARKLLDAANDKLQREVARELRRRHGAESEGKWRKRNRHLWANRFGIDGEEEWHRVPIVSHEFYAAIFDEDGNEIKRRAETIDRRADGTLRVVAATGDGTVIDGPPEARPWWPYQAFKDRWINAEYARMVLAGKNTTTNKVLDGRWCLGSRATGSPFAASGWDARLRHDGPGGALVPDIEFLSKDEDAVADTTGRLLVNGTVITPDGVKTSELTTLSDAPSNIPCDTSMAAADGVYLVETRVVAYYADGPTHAVYTATTVHQSNSGTPTLLATLQSSTSDLIGVGVTFENDGSVSVVGLAGATVCWKVFQRVMHRGAC